MKPVHTVVIGAGPAGIGAALALGRDALVLERASGPGGLCASVSLDGAVFDLGGHSFHTPHAHVRELVHGALPMEECRRDAWCHVAGEWVPYPFQQHFGELSDASVVDECRDGMRVASEALAAADFDEFIERRYGPGIARHFLRPYNRKLWGPDLARLDTSWTRARVAPLREPAAGQEGERLALRDGEIVAYPARGAYGEIFRALAERLSSVRYGESVAAVEDGAVRTRAGERIACRQVVSTLPLPALVALIPDAPAALRDSVSRLAALPLALVMLALEKPLETRRQRVYDASRDFPGHKIVLNHNSSRWLREKTRHGILVEVSGAQGDMDDAMLAVRVVAGLREMGLLSATAGVTASHVLRVALGYPAPTHGRAQAVGEAKAWLASKGITTLGRFGEWDYINSDEALHRGLQAGARLAGAG
ncbi:MAG TPA: FAD-dependent oxidoreductase [Usitatibacter sp.]|nr:FAD-dependent oxidoreductase [Usitatibacter sp.]